MILNDEEILREIGSGNLVVAGWDKLYVGPSSMDLHLDNKAYVIKNTRFITDATYRPHRLDEDMAPLYMTMNDWDEILIEPGDFLLMSTIERIKFPSNISGFVQGRSSIARAGIQVHAAGFCDPGFEGNITLEVTNMTDVPLIVPKHIRFCQIVFARSSSESGTSYNMKDDAKYQGQSGPVMSKIKEEL